MIITIVGLILLSSILCILFFPSFIVSAQKLKAAQSRKKAIENSISIADKDGLQSKLIEIKNDIEALQQENLSPTQLVLKVLINKGPGISLEGFSFTGDATTDRQLIIVGKAESREKLKQFLGRMENQKFKNVDLPISNYAKDKDIAFKMTITISHE